MSQSSLIDKTTSEPHTTYLKNYEVPSFLIDEIDLDFDLSDEHTLVTSHLRVRHNRLSTSKDRTLLLNGDELILVSIKLNDTELNSKQYELTDKWLKIFDASDSFTLTIVTKIFPQNNTALSGLYRTKDTYCTQCEAEGFRRITYYMDHPDILSRFTTTIRADEKKFPYLLSNGNLIESGKSENGRHWARWEDPFKKPSYLFALVAGDFDLVTDSFTTQSGRDISLQIFVEKGYKDQSEHAMFSLKEAMRWDEKAYGREYDLDIYMIVAIDAFNMGAMENKGLNIFNTKYILAKPETATDDDYIHILSVVGHEYFHNWSGNRVTCRDWFQLSLKEGLTIFRDQSFTEDLLSHSVMRIRDVNALREVQFTEDAGPLAHAVRPESYIEINNFYTSTIYNKGAEVLRMMQTLLGKAQFRKGMDLYFARHDGQAVTIEDFIQTMEDVSGVNLTQFRTWYSQAGTPIVTVRDEYDSNAQIYTLFISQKTLPTPGQKDKKPLHIPIRMGLLDAKGEAVKLYLDEEDVSEDKVLELTQPMQSFQFKKVTQRPIPSLLRNFSAPVKLDYPYSSADLQFLFLHDKDEFNRWEAGQKYSLQMMLKLVEDHQNRIPLVMPDDFADVFEKVIAQEHETQPFLLTEMLMLPTEKYIGEQMAVIDVEAIHAVREFVLKEMARRLQSSFLSIYKKLNIPFTHYNFKEVAHRQLKNRCLLYLLTLEEFADLGVEQFNASLTKNMTDTQPAFTGLVNLSIAHRDRVVDDFYQQWKGDALVINKWLATQASSKLPHTLQQVKELMQHESFDIKNPNKVYSLVGAFGRNAAQFHARNGEGYVFLREVVSKLNKLNPQVAARMVNPLTMWKRYDKERQQLMRNQLEVLLQEQKLSKDLYEIVSKSLERG